MVTLYEFIFVFTLVLGRPVHDITFLKKCPKPLMLKQCFDNQ